MTLGMFCITALLVPVWQQELIKATYAYTLHFSVGLRVARSDYRAMREPLECGASDKHRLHVFLSVPQQT